MCRERMERPVKTGMASRTRLSPAERSRLERWEVKTLARVIHPDHGMVIVPHRSNLSAIMNAAEVWRCSWSSITDAEVLPPEKPTHKGVLLPPVFPT